MSGRFTKALLNPPFSQEEEPERDFISQAMESLQTMGLLAGVVKSGIFADEDNALWRENFLKSHSVIGFISLPGDLFYPAAVDTTIMIACAHRPQLETDKVFMAKIWNDGFKKLKGKRVEADGSQLEGESHYIAGTCPYISSGDPQNSIIRLVGDIDEEVFSAGAITVTCFGQAAVQPWRFMARGNGGSAVRVLIPKFRMTFNDSNFADDKSAIYAKMF